MRTPFNGGRWHVTEGLAPHGWDSPTLITDDPQEAIKRHDALEAANLNVSGYMVAIFDNECGEGEPLSPDTVLDMVAQGR